MQDKKRLLFTTTTHVGRNQIPPYMEVLSGTSSAVCSTLSRAFERFLCIGVFSGTSGEKFTGFEAEEVDMLHGLEVADVIIVEADGAKGFPVKGYEAYEPVIPDRTTCHVVVVGVEFFCMPLNEETVFRYPRFLASAGLKENVQLETWKLAEILEHRDIFLKGSIDRPGLRRVLFINKTDLIDNEDDWLRIRDTVGLLTRFDAVYAGSLRLKKNGCTDFGGRQIDTDGYEQTSPSLYGGDLTVCCHRLHPKE